MANWRQDLKFAVRRLAQSPGFAAAAVVSIGLGIAANSTIFSMVSRFLLRPAPVGDPATLLHVQTTERGECCNDFSWPLLKDLREQPQSFSGVAGYYPNLPASVGGAGEPERVWGQATTVNFFDVVQVRMPLGRGFLGEEEHLPVVVLGDRLWRRRFAADPAIAGKTVLLSGRPFTVVGVAPRGFSGIELPLDCEFWVPLDNLDRLLPKTANFAARDYHWLMASARLKPGVTRAAAAAELTVFGQRLAQAYPGTEKGRGFVLEQAGSLPSRTKPVVTMFLGVLSVVVLLVLGIACANVANLLLAQASGRRREMAVRLALGATRGQLMRQMMTESVVLAVTGGVLGMLLAMWPTRALSTFRLPVPVALDLGIDIDWRVLAYTLALSLGAALVFGTAPAWAAARPILSGALKGEDPVARPGRRWTLGNLLVIAQVAMSVVLLCGTGLFLRSLQSASGINVGFRAPGVVTLSIDPQVHGYNAERTVQFLTQLRQRVLALPGVTAAATTDLVPLSMGGRRDEFRAEGQTKRGPSVDLYMVSSGYFDAMGIARLQGRDFSMESATTPRVAVVNEAFVQRLFPGESPIGKHVTGGGHGYQIIGVVRNTKSRTVGEDIRPILYRAIEQDVTGDPSIFGYSLVVRTAGDPAGVTTAVRREIGALDPAMAVFHVQTMEEHLRDALFLPRLAGTLFGAFGMIGLLLAGIGLYSVMSYSVSRRTREIGIRVALGSQSGEVQRLIVSQGMLLTGIALVVGIGAALASAKLATTFLYGVRPHDLLTFTAAPLFLLAVALAACWIPSRRASRVDPLTALRHDG